MLKKLNACLIGIMVLLVALTVPVEANNNSYITVNKVLSGSSTDILQPAGYLIDDNLNSSWGFKSDAVEGWAELKLERKSLIQGLELSGALVANTEMRVDYKRGNNWIPFLAPSIEVLAGNKFIDLSYDEIVTDKIRLRIEGSGTRSSVLTEIKVLGERADSIYHAIEIESIQASENTEYTYPAKFLADGNTYTMWKTKADSNDWHNNWRDRKFDEVLYSEAGKEIFKGEKGNNNQNEGQVLFELGQGYKLNKFNIYFSDQAKGDIEIEVNSKGKWQKIDYISEGSQEGWYRVKLAEEINTDQVRFVVKGYGGGLGGISEVQFWGRGAYKGVSEKLIGIQEATSLDEAINRHFTLTNEEIKDYYLELAIKEEIDIPLTIELNGKEFNIEPTFTLRGYTIYRQKIKQDHLWIGSNFLKVVASKDLILVNARLKDIEDKSRQRHSINQLDDGILFNGADNQQELELSLIPEGYKLPEFPDFPEFPTGLEDKGNVRIRDWSGVTIIADDGYYNRLDVITSLLIDTSNGDRVIRVKDLRLGSNADINIKGNGKVYLYVENNLEIKSGSRINGSGKKDALVVYHKGNRVRFQGGVGGSDKYKFAATLYTQAEKVNIRGGAAVQGTIYIEKGELRIRGGATVAGGSFYTKSGKIKITGGAKVEGSLFSGGDKIVITGGSTMAGAEGGIYAPNAVIDLNGGATIQGKIIATADKVRIGHINHRESYYSIPQIDYTGEKRLIEEVEIYASEDNPYFNLYAWIDGSWVEIYETESGMKSVKYEESIKTDKLLVKNPGEFTIGEIRVKGASTTNREAEIKILTPKEKEVLASKGMHKDKIIGFVDNPDTEIKINGHQVWKRGHYFWLEANRVGIKRWEESSIFAVARDNKGRIGTDKVEVLLGDNPFITIEQPDELVYTGEKTFKISGSIKRPLNQLIINGEEVEIKRHNFTKNIELEEGFNLIKIEVAHQIFNGKRKFVKSIYRKVVCHTKAVELTIGSPLSGYYTKQEQVVVSGMVDGLGDIKVKVNGQEATVAGMFYISQPVSLSEGSNLIKVEAVGQIGKVEKEITVYKDTIAPSIEEVLPQEGYISNNSVVGISGKIIDQSPVWVYTNGKAALQYEGGFNNQLAFVDGEYLINIKAVDMAGNEAYQKINVIVDTTAPEEFAVTADPVDWTNNTQPVISFETTDVTSGIDHYELAIDEGEFEEVESPYQLPVQEDGEHQIRVKAVDKAGWETIAETKVYIDTTPPEMPKYFRPVPGNGKIILRWEKPAPDVVEYIVERESEGVKKYYSIDGEEVEFVDDNLQNAKTYEYRIQAIDRADNKSSKTEWKEGTVGLEEAEYVLGEGAVVEYEGVSLVLPKEGLPEGIRKIEVTEVESEELEEKSVNPIIGSIHEFSAYMEGSTIPEENIGMDKGYIGKIEYDESLVPEGFPEQNLEVYHYDPMFDKWFLVPNAGVDIENNTIYFITNHFSSFSVQATIMQDLSPQEYKDNGVSPLKTYSKHGGIVVSPQGGTASTEMTELSLAGRNGFDFKLKRRYSTANARADALSIGINGKIGFNLVDPSGDLMKFAEIKSMVDTYNNVGDWGEFLDSNLRNLIEKYLFNQGDYAYSMGQGWRLNIPYVKAANSSMILSMADGSMHYINEMEIKDAKYEYGRNKRTLTFEGHEGSDFLLKVTQIQSPIDITSVSKDQILKTRWYSQSYKLIMKDGTVYEMDYLGRTTKKIDPTGTNVIEFNYDGMFLDYIKDSVGRKIRFKYDFTLFWPKITKIWVENDPYQREINYDVDLDGLLDKATDIGGRTSYYEYDLKLLFAGSASMKINFGLMILKIVAGPIAGPASSIFGVHDIELSASIEVQVVLPLDEITAVGQGKTKIEYDTETFIQGDSDVEKVLGIPISVTFSLSMRQRMMADKVKVYLDSDQLIREISYNYDIKSYEGKQTHIYKTVENDGKKKTIYYYKPVEQERRRWEDRSVKIETDNFILLGSIKVVHWNTHVLGVNNKIEIYDVANGDLLRTYTKEYDLDTMRPIKEETIRFGKTRHKEYNYDNWGNVIYNYDSGTGLVTESYYLNTDSSKVGFASPDFSQESVNQNIHNLLGGKIVYNQNSRDGEIKEESNYQYDNKGNLLLAAQYHQDQNAGEKTWIKSSYSYDQYGNLTKTIDPKGNVTETEYSGDYKYAYPTLVKKYQGKDKVYLEDADKQKLDPVVYKYGYDFYQGQKSWEIDPEGNLTEYQYDRLSRVVKITYSEDGEVPDKAIAELSLKDYPNRGDNPVKIQYYDDNQLTTTVVNATEDIAVDDYRVKNESIVTPIFNKSKYYYDKLGRWVKLEQYLKEGATTTLTTSFAYDSQGNRIKTVDAQGKTTKKEYDALNRVTKISYPDSSYTKIEYDDGKNSRTITDREGNKTIEIKDWAGNVIQLTRVNNGVNYSKTAKYDALGNQISMSDELDRRIDYYYNDLNQLIKEELVEDEYLVDGSLRTTRPRITYEYDLNGNKIKEVDAKGKPMSYEYDALNRVIKIIDSEGNVTKKYYDALGQELKIVQVDQNGIELSKSEFDYDSRGNKIAQIDGEGNTSYFAYDIIGKEIAHYDPRGVGISTTNGEREYILDDKYKIESEYDSLGRKIKTSYPSIDGEKIAYDEKIEYDKVGNKTKVITGDKKLEYLYDDSYNVTEQIIRTPEETRTTSYSYDKMGHKLTETDPEGNITTYQYDDLYQLIKIIKADGSSQEYNYDRVGNKLWEKDGNGNLREYDYNGLDKLIAVYEAGVSTPTEYRYDPNGNLVKKVMSNGLVTEYEYNSLNQQIKEVRPNNEVTVYSYDGAGKLKTKINPVGVKEEYLYYQNGQLEQINYYQNQDDEVADESTSYEYDQAGNRILVENGDSSTQQVYDQLGRIVSESRSIEGKVYSTEYKYDKYGNLVGIKYPESNEYLDYGYDSLNQLKYIEGIAGDKENPAFGYNDNGQVERMKYDNGVRTDYTYTDLGRPDTIITNRTNIETGESEELLNLDYEYDGAGNVTRRNNNVYEYDGLNRLVSAEVEGDFYVDNPGNVGQILSDYYGSKGIDVLVNQIEDIALDYDSGSVGVSFGLEVEKISKIELKTAGMADHRISKRTLDIYYSSDNSSYTKLDSDSWEYQQDYKGDITIIIPDRISAKYLKVHSKYDDRNVDFDPVNKGEFTNILKNYIKVYRRESQGTLIYEYDSVGNRLTKKLVTSTTQTTEYQYYDGTNRLMSNGEYAYVYDEAGNLIKKGNNYSINGDEVNFTTTSGEEVEYWEYEYNLQNRLAKVYKNEELIAEFSYDGDSKRIKSIEYTHDGNLKETNFVYSVSGKVIFEDESGDYTSYIFALNKQYAKVKGIVGLSTGITYFHQDNLGSTRLMTDASAKVVMDQDYLPFGGDLARPNQIEVQNDSGENYKYTGQKQVVSIGIYYYGARYYDPEIGRFITEDSYLGELENPQSQNVYIYVLANPLRYVDPTGHWNEESKWYNPFTWFDTQEKSYTLLSEEDPRDTIWEEIINSSNINQNFDNSYSMSHLESQDETVFEAISSFLRRESPLVNFIDAAFGREFITGKSLSKEDRDKRLETGLEQIVMGMASLNSNIEVVNYNVNLQYTDFDYSGTTKVNSEVRDISRRIYQRNDINWDYIDPDKGITNLQRAQKGLAPIGLDGKPIELHHLTQQEPGAMVEILSSTHKEYYSTLHGLVEDGRSFRNNDTLKKQYNNFRSKYWRWRAKNIE